MAWTACAAAQDAPVEPAPVPAVEPAPPPVTASQPTPLECVPACRTGFVCHIGQCVSACNPPCASGLQCTPQLTCELPPDIQKQRTIEDYEAARKRETVRRHDGFYLRAGITVGYAVDHANTAERETVLTGLGGFVDYAIGGTITDGLVLAFAHHMLGVGSPDTEVNGVALDKDHTALYQVLGVLVDFYPDPSAGWHVAWTIGFGAADILIHDEDNAGDLGLGLALGGGHDFWFAEQWSFGLGARLMFIHDSSDAYGDHNALVPMLAISLVYH